MPQHIHPGDHLFVFVTMLLLIINIHEHELEFHILAHQGCISCGTCSYLELTEDHVLTSAYVKIFRTLTRNAVNKSV